MGNTRDDDGLAAGGRSRNGLGSVRRTIYHNSCAAHGQIPVSIFPTSVNGRLALTEVMLLTIVSVVALWVTIESVRYADPTKTMWPSLLVEYLPTLLSLRAALIVAAIVVVYFGLKRLGRGTLAFWAFTALALGSQIPDLWAHNRLDWHRFFGRVAYFSEPLPLATSAAIFLLILVGLVVLHRVNQLRDLAGN